MLKLRIAVVLIVLVGLTLAACKKEEKATPTLARTAAATAAATATRVASPATAAASPASAATATGAATKPAAAADPAKGKVLFQSLPCAGCHGANAEGGGIGPNLKERKPTPDRIRDRVRNGKSPMPAFSKSQVSDEDLENLIAFITSLK